MIVKFQRFLVFALLLGSLLAVMQTVAAQSSDQSLPTPVLTNEINGKIAPLDLGDARLTRHFYAFEGVPGDLLVTVNTKNLNGDIDVFTAITFRPVMKISVYANTLSGEVTKSFYLRARQVLILRVEARTPNDEEGSYQIRFSGAFEPFSGGIPVAESTEQLTEARASDRKTKRVSSVGARVQEPAPEVSPSPIEVKPATENTAEKLEETQSSKRPTTKAASSSRNARGRASHNARSKPATPETKPAKTEPAQSQPEETKKEVPREGEEKPAAVPSEKPTTASTSTAQEPATVPQPGAHLIIEEKDGTKIDRPMATVRRIVVEGGVIVIVLRTGRIERVLMSDVARMAIEP